MSIGGGGGLATGLSNGANGAGVGTVIVGNGATQFSEADLNRLHHTRLCTDSSN